MSLYIGRLSSRTRRGELECVFQRFGRCSVHLKDGYGFVVYDYLPNAEKALRALQGRNICGEPLTLSWSNKQPRPFKRFARADRFCDHEQRRLRSSTRGGDYGDRKLDFTIQRDYEMRIEQQESHVVRLTSADLLNTEIVDYHGHHFTEYLREDKYGFGEDLMTECGQVESDLMESDRWDGQRHDLSNGNNIKYEMEFDSYIGYDRKNDNDNHCDLFSGSPPAQSSQEIIARELPTDEVTLNNSKDSKVHQACFSYGALGHKKRNCPHEKTSGYISRFDHRYDDDDARATLLQDKDFSQMKEFKDTRKASGLGKHGRLTENGNFPTLKETDRAWEKDYAGTKRSKRQSGTPKMRSAKEARSFSSPVHSNHSASRSRSKCKSRKHTPSSVSHSRSKSTSSKAHLSSTNIRSCSVSRNAGSSHSKSSSPTSFSLSVSLGRTLPAPLNKGQLNSKGTLDKFNTNELKDIMTGGEPAESGTELENGKFENEVALVNIENVGTSANVETDMEKDQVMQISNSGNHMMPCLVPQVRNPSTQLSEKGAFSGGSLSSESLRDIKGTQDFDAPTTEVVTIPSIKADTDLTSCHSTSIYSGELSRVLKHYGLDPPDENEKHLSAEAYFGSARLWPWEIIYYRRLKKGPISTENYARRVAQNKDFGIVDKYIRSSSGWGEVTHF